MFVDTWTVNNQTQNFTIEMKHIHLLTGPSTCQSPLTPPAYKFVQVAF